MRLKYKRKGLDISPFDLFKTLNKSQYWSTEDIIDWQKKNLKDLIQSSFADVKFYQTDKYSDLKENVDLTNPDTDFPLITKNDIKYYDKKLLNENQKSGIKHNTSGSTGNPVTVEISGLAESYRMANKIRFYSWYDVNLFDKNILIWRVPQRRKNIRSVVKRMETKFLGRHLLDVFKLNDNSIHDYFERIEKFKPKYIRGYKSGLFELARLMDKHHLKFSKSFIKVGFVTSETLLEQEKVFMENVFNFPIANEYGAADAGLYAVQCPSGSMHINEESVYISVDEENASIVTEIFNKRMPLINYYNEDKISIASEKCVCGRNLSVISEIQGRVTDFIVCEDGSRTHGLVFTGIFNRIQDEFNDGIRQFRVIQEGFTLNFMLIPGKGYTKKLNDRLIELIKERICGSTLEIKIKVVDNIPREKSGKLRYFIRKQ